MKLLLHIDDSINAQEVADAGMEMFTNLPWCTKVELVHGGCGGCSHKAAPAERTGDKESVEFPTIEEAMLRSGAASGFDSFDDYSRGAKSMYEYFREIWERA